MIRKRIGQNIVNYWKRHGDKPLVYCVSAQVMKELRESFVLTVTNTVLGDYTKDFYPEMFPEGGMRLLGVTVISP